MALNKKDLAESLYTAEIDGTALTASAKAKVKKKCDAIAAAIDLYVKEIEVASRIMPLSIDTVGSPAAQKGPPLPVEISSIPGKVKWIRAI